MLLESVSVPKRTPPSWSNRETKQRYIPVMLVLYLPWRDEENMYTYCTLTLTRQNPLMCFSSFSEYRWESLDLIPVSQPRRRRLSCTSLTVTFDRNESQEHRKTSVTRCQAPEGTHRSHCLCPALQGSPHPAQDPNTA